MKHLTITDKYFLEVLREWNFIHSNILREERISKAFVQCLELMLLEPQEEWIRDHLEELAKDAEELLREYILNWKKDSFFAPYREIVKRFYGYTEEEIQAVYKAQCDLHDWEI